MRHAIWISGALVLALPIVASAQWMGVRVPPGYGSTYHHASTYEEGVQRGYADVVRSAGLKNLLDSQAQINWEEARKRAYDNHVYGIQKYFEGRAMNREFRRQERGPRPTEQQLYRIAAERKPDRLGIQNLDPVTGVITWPPVLKGDHFAQDRAELERLFAQRAIAGFLASHELTAVRTHVQSMLAIHKHLHVGNLPTNTYMQAKRFLESLGYEAQLPPG
jgi:hypothetical protein